MDVLIWKSTSLWQTNTKDTKTSGAQTFTSATLLGHLRITVGFFILLFFDMRRDHNPQLRGGAQIYRRCISTLTRQLTIKWKKMSRWPDTGVLSEHVSMNIFRWPWWPSLVLLEAQWASSPASRFSAASRSFIFSPSFYLEGNGHVAKKRTVKMFDVLSFSWNRIDKRWFYANNRPKHS